MINYAKTFFYLLTFIFACSLVACATTKTMTGNDTIYHSFELDKDEFDGIAGVKRVEILDYLYGNPDGYAIRNPIEYRNRGECMQGDNSNGPFLRKEFKILYVKWRDNQTGEVKEVTLDLRKKFPKDFGENYRVFASFKSGQLYVYLITPERRPAAAPPNGPEATAYLKTITLYPQE
jgi:hypothetical protein